MKEVWHALSVYEDVLLSFMKDDISREHAFAFAEPDHPSTGLIVTRPRGQPVAKAPCRFARLAEELVVSSGTFPARRKPGSRNMAQFSFGYWIENPVPEARSMPKLSTAAMFNDES